MRGRLMTVLVAATAASLLPLTFGSIEAEAHSHLLKSSPRAGAILQESPARAVLTFDQPIQDFGGANHMVISGPGNQHWDCGPVRIEGNTVHADVSGLGPTGTYQISYRVIGGDGHPITGSIPIRWERPRVEARRLALPVEDISADAPVRAVSAGLPVAVDAGLPGPNAGFAAPDTRLLPPDDALLVSLSVAAPTIVGLVAVKAMQRWATQ